MALEANLTDSLITETIMKFLANLTLLAMALASSAHAETQIVSIDCYQEDLSMGVRGKILVPNALWDGTLTAQEFNANENSATRPTLLDLEFTSPGSEDEPQTILAPSAIDQTTGSIVLEIASINDPAADYAYYSALVFDKAFEVRDGKVRFSIDFDPFVYEMDEGSESRYPVACKINHIQ
jgi:hypothetical protein